MKSSLYRIKGDCASLSCNRFALTLSCGCRGSTNRSISSID